MAGRGTDILLGGNPDVLLEDRLKKYGKTPESLSAEELEKVKAEVRAEIDAERKEVLAAGGLHILGTERHESRRIDNQLRGRAGRQGDPGSSRFYLSLQDDLLRIFGGERMQNIMLRLGMEEDVPIESKMITSRIAAAQKAVEAQHFASRKHVLEYDDVMNKQREAIYGMRKQLLKGENQKERIVEIVHGIVRSFVDQFCAEAVRIDQYDLPGLQTAILNQFGVKFEMEEFTGLKAAEIEQRLNELLDQRYDEKEQMIGAENLRHAERIIMLNVVDNQWKDHLLSMDHLKEGIGLRGYGQKDPLIEYKKESFVMFQDMMDRIEDEAIKFLYFMRIEAGAPPMPYPEDLDEDDEPEGNGHQGPHGGSPNGKSPHLSAAEVEAQKREAQKSVVDLTRNIQRKKGRELAELQFTSTTGTTEQTQASKGPKVGRNDLCPCGSGKKYKKCHGVNA
jgi:preprotein translocase subunit SecA